MRIRPKKKKKKKTTTKKQKRKKKGWNCFCFCCKITSGVSPVQYSEMVIPIQEKAGRNKDLPSRPAFNIAMRDFYTTRFTIFLGTKISFLRGFPSIKRIMSPFASTVFSTSSFETLMSNSI